MKTEQVNLRLEADLISALERAAKEEYLDRGTMIRKLLRSALEQRNVDRALQQYQLGEISIGRAAEEAKLTHWEILDLARRRGIAYQLDLDDMTERLSLPAEPPPRVAESPCRYDVRKAHAHPTSTKVRSAAPASDALPLPDLRPRPGGVLLVGLNAAAKSAAAGHYYQGRLGKRLWQRLANAGLLPDAVPGAEDTAFVAAGHGLTDLVKRVTQSARDLERDELRRGVDELREKVRAWQPGLVVFVFRQVASLVLGPDVSPGPGAPFEGAPTFLLSGPYAPKDETDRVDAHLRDVLSTVFADEGRVVTSQRVTEGDLEAGIIRLPREAKALLPSKRSEVSTLLRGAPLTAKYDPKLGASRERSGVLRFGKGALSRLVAAGDRLRVSKGRDDRLHLD